MDNSEDKGGLVKGGRGAEFIIGGGLLTLDILNSLPISFMAISITFCNLFMSAIDTVLFKLTLSTYSVPSMKPTLTG